MEIDRTKGLRALSIILKNQKNSTIFERYVYNQTSYSPDIYTWCIYQLVGLLREKDIDMKELAKNVKNGEIGWSSPSYKEVKEKIEEFDEYLLNPFEVVEGISECSKCHSKKTWSVSKQLRSCDEPMTTFSRCVICGHQWSYSG